MEEFLRVGGVVCRYAMAALACWWFFWFLALVGQSAEHSQELAGMAFGKAMICGVAAAIWFYRARKSKEVQKLKGKTNNVLQSGCPVQSDMTAPPISIGDPLSISTADPAPETNQPLIEQAQKPEGSNPAVVWGLIGLVFVILAAISIVAVAFSNKDGVARSTNAIDDALPQKIAPTSVAPCPAGLPAGVESIPIGNLATIKGSDGKVSHGVDGNIDEWYFSFKIANQTAVGGSEHRFSGYCITGLAFVVSVRAADGDFYDMFGKQSFETYLSPGQSQEFTNLSLGSYRLSHNADLSGWRITKAWGFPSSAEGIHN